ncbi:MAG: hypothetical protein ACPG49_12990, partial [Chitinophagales bacterium]
SVQISYDQILDLALQLAKVEKEALIKALDESLVSEEKEEIVEEQEATLEEDGKEEKLDKDFYKFNSTTVEEIKAGKSDYQPVGREYLEKLQEEAKKVWEDEPLTNEELNEQIEKYL